MKILVLDCNFEGEETSRTTLKEGVKTLRNAGYKVDYMPFSDICYIESGVLREYDIVIAHPEYGNYSNFLEELAKNECKKGKLVICSGWGSRDAQAPNKPLDSEGDIVKDINGIYYVFTSYATYDLGFPKL